MKPTLATRKPVEELSATDLETFPLWEFAWDEEGDEDQDETWVRPVEGTVIPDLEASFCAGAVVRLRNGLVYPAVLFGETGSEVDGMALLTVGGRVLFSVGDSKVELRSALKRLGLSQSAVFPVEYSTLATLALTGQPVTGLFCVVDTD